MAYEDAKKAGAVLGYGSSSPPSLSFLIIAWVLFLVVKGINRMRLPGGGRARGSARAHQGGSAADGNPRPAGAQDLTRRLSAIRGRECTANMTFAAQMTFTAQMSWI